jgi:O-antigen/teichoic acid export membrane protein
MKNTSSPRSGPRMSAALRLLVSGSVIGQGLAILSVPLITRLFTPAEVGVFAAAWSLATLLSVTSNLRYEMVIPSAVDERSAAMLLLLCGCLAVPMAAVGAVSAAAAIQADLLGFGALPPWSAVPIGSVAAVIGLGSAVRFWMIRHEEYAAISAMMVRQGLVRLLLTILGGLAAMGWAGLLAGEVGGRVAGAWTPWRRAMRSLHGTAPATITKEISRLARLYRRAPTILLPSTLIDTLAAVLLVPLALHFFGAKEAGMLMIVQRMLSVPSALVGASVGDALHGIAAEDARTAPERLRSLFGRTTSRLALLGVATIGPLAVVAPMAFGLVLGTEWADAGWLATVVAPWAFAGLVVSPVSRLLVVLRRESWKLYYDVSALALLVIGMLVGVRADLSFGTAMAVVSVLQVGAYGVYLIVLTVAIRRPGETTAGIHDMRLVGDERGVE